MEKDELRPCPFCGNKDVVARIFEDNVGLVACCFCNGQLRYYGSVEKAVELWNRRADDDNTSMARAV